MSILLSLLPASKGDALKSIDPFTVALAIGELRVMVGLVLSIIKLNVPAPEVSSAFEVDEVKAVYVPSTTKAALVSLPSQVNNDETALPFKVPIV